MRRFRNEPDPLGSETYASQLIAELMNGDDPAQDEAALIRFIEYATERGGDPMLALIRVLADLAPMPAARIAAEYAANRLVRAGCSDPRWIDDLGHARVVKTRTFGDVYGDQTAVLCTFSGPVRTHALIGFVNLTHPGGFLTDIILTTAIDKAIVSFEKHAAESGGLSRLEEIPPEQASAILRAALAESYRAVDVADEVRQLRALLGARLTVLPSPRPVAVDDAPDRLVNALTENASSRHRDVLEAWRTFGNSYDAGRVDRLSPSKMLAFAEMWNGDGTDVAEVLRNLLQSHRDETPDGLPPAAEAELDETLAEAFPGAVHAAVDTSWLDDLTAS
ncbi:MAG: hypothetical protein QM774_08215 [Gordonia sp. (in: high G+C Gram-positive bacteria)]|uniref:hypothetical protein n=1 Tax=Gordonia sp. (in: high G+C Gram-positive bacteria) TaxID=84139 RepID=UPI0039E6CAAB